MAARFCRIGLRNERLSLRHSTAYLTVEKATQNNINRLALMTKAGAERNKKVIIAAPRRMPVKNRAGLPPRRSLAFTVVQSKIANDARPNEMAKTVQKSYGAADTKRTLSGW